MKLLRRLCAALLLAPAVCLAQALPTPLSMQSFALYGDTMPVVAAVTCPTPVQVSSIAPAPVQYVVSNLGTVPAFIAYGATSAAATANCAIPSGTTGYLVQIVLPLSQVTITASPNYYFTAITSSSTADLYVSPGLGQ